ncbi:transmembrane protein 234 homolog [Coccinella septempunctata]|uniref:transmembrane protein 234 homolog n=1 Tax=Coccinella septempunctata TaxID=41139 RepID=UPI001D091A22|nr:transmembrane protein 234 homolog [Coccinella septempunctata]
MFEIGALVTVALLWGCTNPILKRNSTKIVEIKSTSKIQKFYLEVKYLFTNLDYMIPFIVNQLGSVIYFIALQNIDISLALPVSNSLTFVFTAIMGWILGEDLPKRNVSLGILLIFIGTALCSYAKQPYSN